MVIDVAGASGGKVLSWRQRLRGGALALYLNAAAQTVYVGLEDPVCRARTVHWLPAVAIRALETIGIVSQRDLGELLYATCANSVTAGRKDVGHLRS